MNQSVYHRRADHIRIRRIEDAEGRERFAISNDVTGAIFRADSQTVDFLQRLDGRTPLAAAANDANVDPAFLHQLVGQLAANGLIDRPGETIAQPARRPPLESRLIFFRIGLGDVSGLIDWLLPVARLPFTPVGVTIWLVLVLSAAFTLLGSWNAFRRAFAELTEITWQGATVLATIFLLLKVLHEIGHATALRHFADRERLSTGPIHVGIAFFALMPIPFTDATEAWMLKSRFRRAAIGLAGIYFESWIAALAALILVTVRPGEMQTVLFQVLIISGVSTLLFNLNPLARLDGYFVLTDLIGQPNLAGRAAMAAQNVALRVLGAPVEVGRIGHLVYWLGSAIYRWTIFAGIFWLAHSVDPRISWLVVPLALMILVVRPIVNFVVAARGQSLRPARIVVVGLTGLTLIAVLVVPVPDTLHVYARLVLSRSETVRLNEDARITWSAPIGWVAPNQVIVSADSPRLELNIAHLRLDASRLEGILRSDGLSDAATQQVLRGSLERVQEQIASRIVRLNALVVEKPVSVFWQPEAARDYSDTWIAAYHNRVLGTISHPGPPIIEAFIAQSEFDDTTRFAPRSILELKAVARPRCTTSGRVIDQVATTLANREVFRLQVAVAKDDRCLADLPDGSGAVVRLKRGNLPLVWQAIRYVERLAQGRIPLPTQR